MNVFTHSYDPSPDILGFGNPFMDSINQRLQSLFSTGEESFIE